MDWDAFVASEWRRRPTELPAAAVFDRGEVLRAVADSLWGDPARYAPMARVYADCRRATTPLGPASEAQPPDSVGDLLARCRRDAGAGELTVVVNDIQIASPALLRAAQRFVAPLVERVGLPVDRLGVDVFAGDYAELPFGWHVDPSDTFLFGVEGVRRIRTDLGDGERAFDVRPGERLYWPRAARHLGACPEGPAMAVTISWWSSHDALDDAGHALLSAWRNAAAQAPIGDGVAYGAGPADEPAATLREAARAWTSAASDNELAHRILLDHWLAKRTALGFHPLPRPRNGEPPAGPLRRTAVAPLLAVPFGDGVRVAGGGGVCQAPKQSAETVARLNAGEAAGEDLPAEVRERLWRWRALG